jgi:hypothetical protein
MVCGLTCFLKSKKNLKTRELKSTKIVHYLYRVLVQITKKKEPQKSQIWILLHLPISSLTFLFIDITWGGEQVPPPQYFFYLSYFWGGAIDLKRGSQKIGVRVGKGL